MPIEALDKGKISIRQSMLRRRDALTFEEVSSCSELIVQRLFDSDILSDASKIALYAPIKNEVRTERLFQHLKEAQREIFYPLRDGQRLVFVAVNSFSDLQPGSMGILEPQEGERVEGAEINAMVLPGVAFDLRGERIGFGKGYYDRTLSHYRGKKIALAYDFQVLPEIPRDDHDVHCDWIITEKRTVHPVF